MTHIGETEDDLKYVVGDSYTYGKVDYVTCRARVRRNGWDPVTCSAQIPLPATGALPERCPLCFQPLPWYGTETS